MRFLTLAVSLFQFLFNTSNKGIGCLKQPDGLLADESWWLSKLVVMQVVKVIAFTIWSRKVFAVDQQRDPSAHSTPSFGIEKEKYYKEISEDTETDDEEFNALISKIDKGNHPVTGKHYQKLLTPYEAEQTLKSREKQMRTHRSLQSHQTIFSSRKGQNEDPFNMVNRPASDPSSLSDLKSDAESESESSESYIKLQNTAKNLAGFMKQHTQNRMKEQKNPETRIKSSFHGPKPKHGDKKKSFDYKYTIQIAKSKQSNDKGIFSFRNDA